MCCFFFFFFKQKTAYEMRISDWSSDVCSSDLRHRARRRGVLSLRQVSLHKQRKVARVVTARKLLILIQLAPDRRRSRAARCARALIRPPGTFSRSRETGSISALRALSPACGDGLDPRANRFLESQQIRRAAVRESVCQTVYIPGVA